MIDHVRVCLICMLFIVLLLLSNYVNYFALKMYFFIWYLTCPLGTSTSAIRAQHEFGVPTSV